MSRGLLLRALAVLLLFGAVSTALPRLLAGISAPACEEPRTCAASDEACRGAMRDEGWVPMDGAGGGALFCPPPVAALAGLQAPGGPRGAWALLGVVSLLVGAMVLRGRGEVASSRRARLVAFGVSSVAFAVLAPLALRSALGSLPKSRELLAWAPIVSLSAVGLAIALVGAALPRASAAVPRALLGASALSVASGFALSVAEVATTLRILDRPTFAGMDLDVRVRALAEIDDERLVPLAVAALGAGMLATWAGLATPSEDGPRTSRPLAVSALGLAVLVSLVGIALGDRPLASRALAFAPLVALAFARRRGVGLGVAALGVAAVSFAAADVFGALVVARRALSAEDVIASFATQPALRAAVRHALVADGAIVAGVVALVGPTTLLRPRGLAPAVGLALTGLAAAGWCARVATVEERLTSAWIPVFARVGTLPKVDRTPEPTVGPIVFVPASGHPLAVFAPDGDAVGDDPRPSARGWAVGADGAAPLSTVRASIAPFVASGARVHWLVRREKTAFGAPSGVIGSFAISWFPPKEAWARPRFPNPLDRRTPELFPLVRREGGARLVRASDGASADARDLAAVRALVCGPGRPPWAVLVVLAAPGDDGASLAAAYASVDPSSLRNDCFFRETVLTDHGPAFDALVSRPR